MTISRTYDFISGKGDLAAELSYSRMEELISFLDTFRIYSEKLQSNSMPTSPIVVPAYMALCEHCQPKDDDSDVSMRQPTTASSFHMFVSSKCPTYLKSS